MQLKIPDNPMKHWCDGSRWEMVDYMCEEVLKRIQIATMANFFSLNANKVSIVDNQFQHSIHVYVMHARKIIPILFTFQHFVEGGNANDLTTMIVQSLMQQRGLPKKETSTRLICFVVNEAFLLQGRYIGMIFQMKEKHVLSVMGQHCMAHKTNNNVQILSNLSIVAKLEDLL